MGEGKCYTFKITDTYGDGLSAGQGGSYVGSLDDDVAFQGDGQFDYEDVRKFCVGGGNNNPEPSKAPTMKPSKAPTNKPTKSPTNKPTNAPTNKPTDSPVDSPTTSSPTQSPTVSPTSSPTSAPTTSSTASPTNQPTDSPTKNPTQSPTKALIDDDNNDDNACKDDANFLWKGQTKKDCKWVGKGTDPKIVKKMQKKQRTGSRYEITVPKLAPKLH